MKSTRIAVSSRDRDDVADRHDDHGHDPHHRPNALPMKVTNDPVDGIEARELGERAAEQRDRDTPMSKVRMPKRQAALGDHHSQPKKTLNAGAMLAIVDAVMSWKPRARRA